MEFIAARSAIECLQRVRERRLLSRLLAVFVDQYQPLSDAGGQWRAVPLVPTTTRLVRHATDGRMYECAALAWIAPTSIRFDRVATPPPTAVGRWHRYPQPAVADGERPMTASRANSKVRLVHGASLEGVSQLIPDGLLVALQSMPVGDAAAAGALHCVGLEGAEVATVPLNFDPLTRPCRILATQGNLITRLDDAPSLDHVRGGALYLETDAGALIKVLAGDPGRGMLALDPQVPVELRIGQTVRLGTATPPSQWWTESRSGLVLTCLASADQAVPSLHEATTVNAAMVEMPDGASLVVSRSPDRSGLVGGVQICSSGA